VQYGGFVRVEYSDEAAKKRCKTMLQVKTKSGRMFNLPSDEDDARIRAGIAADPTLMK